MTDTPKIAGEDEGYLPTGAFPCASLRYDELRICINCGLFVHVLFLRRHRRRCEARDRALDPFRIGDGLMGCEPAEGDADRRECRFVPMESDPSMKQLSSCTFHDSLVEAARVEERLRCETHRADVPGLEQAAFRRGYEQGLKERKDA